MAKMSMKVFIALSLFLSAANAASSRSVSWGYVDGGFCPLHLDDGMVFSGGLEGCKGACLAKDGCKGFVIMNSGPGEGTCTGRTDKCEMSDLEINQDVSYWWLASLEVTDATPEKTLVSSSSVISWQSFNGVSCDGGLEDDWKWSSTVEECKNQCLAQEGCVGFQWDEAGTCQGRSTVCEQSSLQITADKSEYTVQSGSSQLTGDLKIVSTTRVTWLYWLGGKCTSVEDDGDMAWEGTADECKDKCRATDGCLGFNFSPGEGEGSGKCQGQSAGVCKAEGLTLAEGESYYTWSAADSSDISGSTQVQSQSSRTTVITWTFYSGAECPLYTDEDLEWDGTEDECKQKCVDSDKCKGFVFYASGHDKNCYGRTDVCKPDQFVSADGALMYYISTGGESALQNVQLSQTTKITWMFMQGANCPKYSNDDWVWDGSVDDCKSKCVETDGCAGFVFYAEGKDNNCYGKKQACAADEYEIEAGAAAYSFSTGEAQLSDLTLTRTTRISWTYYLGVLCNEYGDGDLAWEGDLETCKQECVDNEKCTSFIFMEPVAGQKNCKGKTQICQPEQYKLDANFAYYILGRGDAVDDSQITISQSTRITWNYYSGIHCPLYDGAEMQWELELSDCQKACADNGGCMGFTYLEPADGVKNCIGKTDYCGQDEYELKDGYQAWILLRGDGATPPVPTITTTTRITWNYFVGVICPENLVAPEMKWPSVTLAECQNNCVEADTCTGFTWTNPEEEGGSSTCLGHDKWCDANQYTLEAGKSEFLLLRGNAEPPKRPTVSTTIVIRWMYWLGIWCPSHISGDMKWEAELDDCKQKCLDEESCEAVSYLEPAPGKANCLGQTSWCQMDQYELKEGAQAWLIRRGEDAQIPQTPLLIEQQEEEQFDNNVVQEANQEEEVVTREETTEEETTEEETTEEETTEGETTEEETTEEETTEEETTEEETTEEETTEEEDEEETTEEETTEEEDEEETTEEETTEEEDEEETTEEEDEEETTEEEDEEETTEEEEEEEDEPRQSTGGGGACTARGGFCLCLKGVRPQRF